MNFLKRPVIFGLLVGGVILFLNILILFVGPIIFPGESGLILFFPIMILNFPVFGYRYYDGFGVIHEFHLICFILSPAFYFLCVYFIIHAFNKSWRNRKDRYSMAIAGVAIIFILLGSVFAKEIKLQYAIRQLEKYDITSYKRLRQSFIVHRCSSTRHTPKIIEILKTLPEDDHYSIIAKTYLIQTLENHRAKEAIPVLLELIKIAGNEVAEKAIEAVGAIEGPDEAIPLIVEYIEKNNYRFIRFPQGWTFKKYRSDPELALVLLKACNNIENNNLEKAWALEALAYVADYETLLKIRERYRNNLSKWEYSIAQQAIEKELRKKRVHSENQQ